MKHVKKLVSLVLALVMALLLSVTAFAAGNTAPTVTIKVNGVVVGSTSASAGQSVYTHLISTYGDSDGWYSFSDINQNQAYALWRLTVGGTTYTSGAIDGASSGITGVQWSTTRRGYGFEGFAYDDDGVIAGYKYIYVGNDFTYTVTNNDVTVDVSDKYMNQYTMQDGDEVVVELAQVVSRWTATTAFEAEAPYI